ncbi:hypothetical protein [Trichlorobacter ammonificans]|uniref:Lipoprotein n=1 Tax=Trichlorobacter ammonificans TaxID=2916410 RepID=A0ABN8HJU2_9BACT|nr:hypothetical protein [Trichlorobacter ammonificans]CAH2031600.1 conserved protein of unknown function [Trichlorobacter ammonificans]
MKKSVIVALALAVVALIGIVVVTTGSAKALNVNDVGNDPASFTGTITITGIMGGISNQDPSIFGIMDIKELQCTTQNCNKLFIPIKYQGQMPKFGDEVRLTGSFVKLADGYLFSAHKLKVVRNHKIGG